MHSIIRARYRKKKSLSWQIESEANLWGRCRCNKFEYWLSQGLVYVAAAAQLLLNKCLGHKLALVMSHAAASVSYINLDFQPLIEELFRFISNSVVRHSIMQAAFTQLGLKEVAILCAFFTRWMAHGKVC